MLSATELAVSPCVEKGSALSAMAGIDIPARKLVAMTIAASRKRE
jgi:hypothetical protein